MGMLAVLSSCMLPKSVFSVPNSRASLVSVKPSGIYATHACYGRLYIRSRRLLQIGLGVRRQYCFFEMSPLVHVAGSFPPDVAVHVPLQSAFSQTVVRFCLCLILVPSGASRPLFRPVIRRDIRAGLALQSKDRKCGILSFCFASLHF